VSFGGFRNPEVSALKVCRRTATSTPTNSETGDVGVGRTLGYSPMISSVSHLFSDSGTYEREAQQ